MEDKVIVSIGEYLSLLDFKKRFQNENPEDCMTIVHYNDRKERVRTDYFTKSESALKALERANKSEADLIGVACDNRMLKTKVESIKLLEFRINQLTEELAKAKEPKRNWISKLLNKNRNGIKNQ